jgi:hypothetical protein
VARCIRRVLARKQESHAALYSQYPSDLVRDLVRRYWFLSEAKKAKSPKNAGFSVQLGLCEIGGLEQFEETVMDERSTVFINLKYRH